MRRMRTRAGGGVMLIALSLLPCALHPSANRQTRIEDIREGLDEDKRHRSAADGVFDIVTVEGEGCSAAGWEEMSEGDTERITDGSRILMQSQRRAQGAAAAAAAAAVGL
ncbi:hypothetical protein E3U43_004437 [Larimichthys crocea]|uniref:Uncharacterized protein n=1 Tax=Larimichthys crocea TaxID=215358 RepID=A0ACD3QDI7_LARCR|nr:hypothetical protein E3U43_004437 [Larimichthys crocea]